MPQSSTITPPLASKLAIITGASRGPTPSTHPKPQLTSSTGIGAAIAANLASKGCSLILNHSTPASASTMSETASLLTSTYPNLHLTIVCADLSTLTGPAAIVAAAEGAPIDIIINNAGVAGNQSIASTTPEEFARLYNVNVRGPLLLLQAALPFLPHDRSGRIVNMSSISASLGLRYQSVYGGTKAALEAMTRTWATELAERATVNSVNPGPVDTRMFVASPVLLRWVADGRVKV